MTLLDQYEATLPTKPHLNAVRAAVERYGVTSVSYIAWDWDRLHLGIIAGLAPTATFATAALRPLPWWTVALAELGRRFRPVSAPVPPCNVLVYDASHKKLEELNGFFGSWGGKADTAIVLTGSRPNAKAVYPAVAGFVKIDPAWVIAVDDSAGDGTLVLSRDPADRPAITHGLKDAYNFFKAELARRAEGGTYLPLPMAQERIDTCLTCVHRGGAAGGQCRLCKCFLFQVPPGTPMVAGNPGKVFYPSQNCPISKWVAKPGEGVVMTPEATQEMLITAFQSPPGEQSAS